MRVTRICCVASGCRLRIRSRVAGRRQRAPMKRITAYLSALILLLAFAAPGAQPSSLRFEVTIAPGLVSSPRRGRLFVVRGRASQPEPRLTIGQTGLDASPVFARDIGKYGETITGTIDDTSAAFPI